MHEAHSQIDYFEKDRIVVSPSHPLYAQVIAAHDLQQVKRGYCVKGSEAAYRQEILDGYSTRRAASFPPLATATIQ